MPNWRTLAVLLLVAAALRIPMLDQRPMHADEAVQADRFLAASPYDPHEYHGPVLRWLTWIPADRVNESTLRLVPAMVGILLALSPLLFLQYVGPGAAVWAAVLCAVSPGMVYYSRDYIPEVLLALWTALFLLAVLRRSWFFAGVAATLMVATKETAVVALAAAALAWRPRAISWRAAGLFLLFP